MPGQQSPHSQLRTIFLLFIILRLTILFLYTPQGLLNAYTDYSFYYRTSQMSEQGYWPFINMWYEYPPLSTYIVQGVYWLARSVLPMGDLNSIGYLFYTRLLGMVLLIFESGVLLLIHAIAQSVWDIPRANWLAWIYASLSLPLFYWSGTHTTIVTFFFLLAVYLYIRGKTYSSATAIGLGFAAKMTPIVLLAPMAKFEWRKNQKLPLKMAGLLWVGLTAGFSALATYLPFFLLGGGKYILASFQALGRVAPWSTAWAMMNGYWGPGDYGPIPTRLQLEMAALPNVQPSVFPEWLKLVLFGALYAWIFLRPLKKNGARGFLWFSTLTILIFHLWSKGWSPQWAATLIPFLLLSFPSRKGLVLVLLLTGFTFLEWPISSVFNFHPLAALAILGRTGLLAVAAYWCYRKVLGHRTVVNPV